MPSLKYYIELQFLIPPLSRWPRLISSGGLSTVSGPGRREVNMSDGLMAGLPEVSPTTQSHSQGHSITGNQTYTGVQCSRNV